MHDRGLARQGQIEKGFQKIPFNPKSAHTLFTSPEFADGNTDPEEHTLGDGSSTPFKEYLGDLLRKYIEFLVETMTDHTLRIANCTFPLMTTNHRRGSTEIKSKIIKILDNSDLL